MAGNALKLHLLWGSIAIAAFAVGSLRSPGSGAGKSSSDEQNAANASIRRSDDPNGPGSRSLAKGSAGNGAEKGMILDLFGSYSAGSVGLSTLAEQAFRDPNPITRRLAFGELLASMTPENAGEMREQLLALGARGDEWRDFNYSWGALSGREAIDIAASSREEDLSATMSGWAAANPTEAIGLLDNLPETMAGSRAQIAEAVIAGLADRDLGSATDLAMRLAADGTGRADRLIGAVANEALRQGGPAEAAFWAEGLTDGAVKGAAMDRVARDYVRSDPEAAAAWIGRFAGDEYASRAVAEVGEEWGERDPNSAVGWLETLPEGRGQADGFRSVLGDWEDKDPVAASQYLSQMSPSPQRDAAVSGFARGYAWQDPQAAIAWAQDISDPALRQQSLTQVGEAYYRRQPDAAKTWLKTSGLSQEAQNRVLKSRR